MTGQYFLAGQKNGKGLVKTVYSRGISSSCTFYFQESENCQKLYNFVMKKLQKNLNIFFCNFLKKGQNG